MHTRASRAPAGPLGRQLADTMVEHRDRGRQSTFPAQTGLLFTRRPLDSSAATISKMPLQPPRSTSGGALALVTIPAEKRGHGLELGWQGARACTNMISLMSWMPSSASPRTTISVLGVVAVQGVQDRFETRSKAITIGACSPESYFWLATCSNWKRCRCHSKRGI